MSFVHWVLYSQSFCDGKWIVKKYTTTWKRSRCEQGRIRIRIIFHRAKTKVLFMLNPLASKRISHKIYLIWLPTHHHYDFKQRCALLALLHYEMFISMHNSGRNFCNNIFALCSCYFLLLENRQVLLVYTVQYCKYLTFLPSLRIRAKKFHFSRK